MSGVRRACSRCSSASRSSRARPRTSWRPPRRRASSRTRCATPSTTGSPASPQQATSCSTGSIERAEERLRRRQEKEVARKTATRKLRLPGKLADCTQRRRRRHRALHRRGRFGRRLGQAGARPRDPGGPAAARQDPQRRQRRRATSCARTRSSPTSSRRSAAAPARTTATTTCATSKVIIMTDADVDGAHIASLLITFFYQRDAAADRRAATSTWRVPPLYRLTPGRQDRLRPRRRAQGRAARRPSSRATARSRSAASRAWAR